LLVIFIKLKQWKEEKVESQKIFHNLILNTISQKLMSSELEDMLITSLFVRYDSLLIVYRFQI
ncbi:MAG: hypothetical protein ACLFNL_04355, partial [Bacteroidales bacterium]